MSEQLGKGVGGRASSMKVRVYTDGDDVDRLYSLVLWRDFVAGAKARITVARDAGAFEHLSGLLINP